jgi:hypothetical protein
MQVVVYNKCLQLVKNFQYPSYEISCENEKNIQQKLANFDQILGILNNIFKPTMVQKFSRIKYIRSKLLPFFYMDVKFGPLEKRIKHLASIEITFFTRTVCYASFDHKSNE